MQKNPVLKTSELEILQAIGNAHHVDEIKVVNIDFENLQYPEDLFCHFADKPWAMWLDSCESQHPDSQFDILVWQPCITISTTDNTSVIVNKQNNETASFTEDPLTLVQLVQQSIYKNTILPNVAIAKDIKLPFIGGAVGYFSYDLGRRFEKLPQLASNDIEQADMEVGFYQFTVLFDRINKRFYLAAPQQQLSEIKQEITSLLANQPTKPLSNDFALTSDWQANMSKADYQQKFKQVNDYLLAGDCYQINLAQRFHANYQGDEFQAYLKLREHNQAPFSAFLRFDESSVLSLSPERFLKLDDKQVQTKPIKGTRPRGENTEEDLANAHALQTATKDRAENLMIVDLLRNDLSKVCVPGTVKVPEIFAIESFPAVHHLVSTVEGKLEEKYSACDLLRAAFPGGSITGAPKIRAMEVIEELEPHRRNLYCGSIGYISANGNMDTSITIRTLICENDKIYCWAGGGLVADSIVESEYQETLDKVNKILPVLKS